MLTRRDDSSLVVYKLCDQVRGQNKAVVCFYFDFAARKEQSATNILGSLVKQMVRGMERIPDEILTAFQEQEKVIGGCGPQLVDLVKMLQTITSTRPTFVCIDALDECVGAQRVKVLNSLKHILDQCSQSSGAPVGPGGGTAKSPGRDGTTKCRPSSSLNFQDGRH